MIQHITTEESPLKARPPKPYKEFPLSPHKGGAWCKKIKGKIHYFGRWGQRVNGKMERLPGDGWKEALEEYLSQVDDLRAGRRPRVTLDQLTVKDLCNEFLTAKHLRLETGKLSRRSWDELDQTARRLVGWLGRRTSVDDLRPQDFAKIGAELARYSPNRQTNEIGRIKQIFKYASDNRLVEKPVIYGSEFKPPSKAEKRKYKSKGGKRLFTAVEIRQLLSAASPPIKAAILMGINAGLGNTDVADLEFQHLDLEFEHVDHDRGWLDYPRGKTGTERRCPLWPETVEALQTAIAERPEPLLKADAEVVLLTTQRQRLVRDTEHSRTDGVSVVFGKLLRKLGINGRDGLGFYSLRHTLATIGLQTGDRDAVKALMGHIEQDMLATYDETGPSDERRRAVTEYVHDWLFNEDIS